MATTTTTPRVWYQALVLAMVVATVLAAPVTTVSSAPHQDQQMVANSVCYSIHLTSLPQPDSPVLARGLGLVQKYLSQASERMDAYRRSLLADRLVNKTLPGRAAEFQLPEPPRSAVAGPGSGPTLVDLFHRLAVSCLLFETLADQELRVGELHWSHQLELIKGELVESLCHMHILLYLTNYRLSGANVRAITDHFTVSMSLPLLPHEDREWRYLRDYMITGAVHRVTQRSISELEQVSANIG